MENEEFSEFSYGFALTDELIHWHGTPLTAAPVFPSLQKEGQPGGGYDVKLPGVPLFLQFKLSHRMQRNNAREVKKGHVLKTNFYRMYLRPRNRSNQHALLLRLESSNNLVFYAAPAFFETAELDDAYQSHRVVERSVFFRPSAIGRLTDDDRHHLSFQNNSSTHGYFFSPEEPKRVPAILGRTLHIQVQKELDQRAAVPITQETLSNISNSMVVALKEEFAKILEWFPRHLDQIQGQLNALQQIAYFSRTYFDSTFFIVQRKA
jgi:hypothetical protein